MELKSLFTWFTPYQKRQFGQKLEQGDQMDQIIIVFIPVKKNVSVLLKLIVVVKVRRSEFFKPGKSGRYFSVRTLLVESSLLYN